MQITDMLAQAGALQSVARDLNIPETQVASGAEALMPAILGGFKRQAQPAGLGGLGDLLGQLGGGGLLDQILTPQRTDPGAGNDVLGQIFGSKEVSRTVAQDAAARSGLDPALLRKMLPLLAMAVAGFMARQKGGATTGAASAPTGGGLGDLLGGLLGGARPAGAGSPAGGLGALLDLDGNGNPLDDLMRLAGKALR